MIISLLFVSPLALAATQFQKQTVIKNYDMAKEKYFWKELYPNGGETLYCALDLQGNVSIEHIYPADWIAEFYGCQNRGSCDHEDYKFAEGDLHNLWPALQRINSSRADLPYGEIPDQIEGTRRFEDICPDYERTYDDNPVVEPRDPAKGTIARSLLYMSMSYGLPLRGMDEMLIRWHKDFPPEQKEKDRNQKILLIQNTENFFISQPALVDNLLPDNLKIASWNIYWLVNTNRNKRQQADYDYLKEIAKSIDADIIALQEVENEDYAKRIFGDTYGYYFSDRPGNKGTQRVGFAIKKEAEIRVIEAKAYEDLDTGGVRYGMDLIISRHDRTLRLLGVHLKSGCFEKPLDKGTLEALPDKTKKQKKFKNGCTKLAKQIKPLERWVDDRAKEQLPFIVLGDFNRRLEVEKEKNYKESQGIWPELDDPRSRNPNEDLVRLNEGIAPKCWPNKFQEFIDHIIADPRAMEIIVPNSFEEFRYDGKTYAEHKMISDHCPISVEIFM